MNRPIELTTLAAAWRAAKDAEEAARQQRLDIEASLLESVPTVSEGTASLEAGPYKVTVTTKLNRSVDSDKLQGLWDRLVPKAQGCFTWKATIKVAELRKVQEFIPDSYALLATVIEAKPAKASISVELI
jgi:hypothetical protein